ncbi:MAG: hypothetical protein ABEN55_14730 [Bradymonadaceae bacterium]
MTDPFDRGEANVEPIQDPMAEMMDQQLMVPDVEVKVKIFRLYKDDRNGELDDYRSLVNELYDQDSRKVELASYGREATWTQDGAYQVVIHYGVLPEQEEDDTDPDEAEY